MRIYADKVDKISARFSTYCLTIYLTYNSCLMVRVLAVNERADISRDH